VKYACIAQQRDSYPVALMCRVLQVARTGFYAWLERAPSARAQADARLGLEIRAIHAASRQRYGRPRIHRELRAQGTRVSAKRVGRLLRAEGLRPKRARRYVVTTQSAAGPPLAPNRLGRQFAVARVPGRDRIWVADATACWTAQGWLYLAVVLDLASRRVVGWAAGATLDQTLTMGALQRALTLRQPPPGLLHHSDQGTPYLGGAYQGLLARHGCQVSCSRRGDCWDNAVMESFFATLKTELVHEAAWPTRAQAAAELAGYLDGWYNYERRHSSLGYLSPVDYERQQRQHPAA
jgi:transposase InsO family protein